MSDLAERFKNLSPQQQKVLRQRLQKKGVAVGDKVSQTAKQRKMDFSVFFFSADGTGAGSQKYNLLTQTARFADQNGFKAIWTPERHFQAFGGLYPNPAVTNANLAAITRNIRLRAGSVVAPLHSPVRIAEDWSMVDNLSEGRVDIAFATGWHESDYVIQPLNYENRRNLMFQYIDIVRRLWRGETVEIPGVGNKPVPVETFPRPVQAELPYWVTATSPRTWQDAGKIGANILTMMATNYDDLVNNIKLYRDARTQNGHDPRKGVVTVMLHTYLDHDADRARDKTRSFLTSYLTNFLGQMKDDPEAEQFTDQESLLAFAFERYFSSDALLGPPEKCMKLVDKLADAGVNEAACLIDFGPSPEDVLASLELLCGVRDKYLEPNQPE